MVKTICYGQEKEWASREEAMEFFANGIIASEGSEQERYCAIYEQLQDGCDVATDEF